MKKTMTLAFVIAAFLLSLNTLPTIHGNQTSTTPSVSILSPNGGESLKIGSSYNITWKLFNWDSDYDSMNDSVDPYPFDFNNDGIPDLATWGDHRGGYGPDVDGDNWTDYPFVSGYWYQQDCWLNTTVPHHPPFYTGYWDKNVSIYIGPYSLETYGYYIPRLSIEYSYTGVNGTYVSIISSVHYLDYTKGFYLWDVPDTPSNNGYMKIKLFYSNTTIMCSDMSDHSFIIEKIKTGSDTSIDTIISGSDRLIIISIIGFLIATIAIIIFLLFYLERKQRKK